MSRKKKSTSAKEVHYKELEKTTDKYRKISVISDDYSIGITSCFEDDSLDTMSKKAKEILKENEKKELGYIT